MFYDNKDLALIKKKIRDGIKNEKSNPDWAWRWRKITLDKIEVRDDELDVTISFETKPKEPWSESNAETAMANACGRICRYLRNYSLEVTSASDYYYEGSHNGYAEIEIGPDAYRYNQGRMKSFKQSQTAREDLGISDEEWEKMKKKLDESDSDGDLAAVKEKGFQDLKNTFKDLFSVMNDLKEDIFTTDFILNTLGLDPKDKGNLIVASNALDDMRALYSSRASAKRELQLGMIIRIPDILKFIKYFKIPDNWPKQPVKVEDAPANYNERMRFYEKKVRDFLNLDESDVEIVSVTERGTYRSPILLIEIFFKPFFSFDEFPFLKYDALVRNDLNKENFFINLEVSFEKYIGQFKGVWSNLKTKNESDEAPKNSDSDRTDDKGEFKELKKTLKTLFKHLDNSKKILFKPDFILMAFGYVAGDKENLKVAKYVADEMSASYLSSAYNGELCLGLSLDVWPGIEEYYGFERPEGWPKYLKTTVDRDSQNLMKYSDRMGYYSKRVKDFLTAKGFKINRVDVDNRRHYNGLEKAKIDIYFETGLNKDDFPYLEEVFKSHSYDNEISKEGFFENLEKSFKKYIED